MRNEYNLVPHGYQYTEMLKIYSKAHEKNKAINKFLNYIVERDPVIFDS